MPADDTLTLIGVEAALAVLYPDTTIYRAKRPVAGNRPPLGGWNPGWMLPCFVVSATDPEEVDAGGDFESVTVAYGITIEWCKASAAKTQDGADPMMADDAEFRDKRKAIRGAIYKPGVGTAASPTNVRNRNRPVYEVSGAGGMPVTVSGMIFTYEVTEPRAE